eukprot:11591838-Prorocentrum_lima.AAC.1
MQSDCPYRRGPSRSSDCPPTAPNCPSGVLLNHFPHHCATSPRASNRPANQWPSQRTGERCVAA